jgi:HAE1 family hydrophobic/amphiphilic exporter-1
MQKLAEICVRRPVFATMLIVALTVIGAFSFFTLGVDRFPKIELPIITVATANPGAAPEQIETEITDIIESTVSTISGSRPTSVEGLSVAQLVLEKDVMSRRRRFETKWTWSCATCRPRSSRRRFRNSIPTRRRSCCTP